MKKSTTHESILNEVPVLPRPIVLIGMMGAGKSSVGQALARLAQAPFLDADREIEAASGRTVPQIFADFGEAEFRRLERQVIARLLAAGPCVLALGGGAFVNEETRARVKTSALSVWLRVEPEILLQRVLRHGDRPLLKGGDPAQKLSEILAVREPIYALADLAVQCDDSPVAVTAGRVWDAVKLRLIS